MAGSFAALVRQWRARAMLSQEQLAARAGLGVRTIRRLETGGIRRPHGDSVRALADALGLGEAERTRLAAAAADCEAPAAVPRQLPPPVRRFVGRADELKRLADLLGDAAAAGSPIIITAIGGTAGIGKTALALHWSHQVADRFPAGQLYVNLRGFDPSGQVMDPAAAIRNFLEALGVPSQRIPADPQAQAALFRTSVAGRRMLIVLDNARDSGQVRPLLPGSGDCLVVVTSRNQLTGLAGDGAHPINLDLLSTLEAQALFTQLLGAARIAAEPGAVDDIIVRCARLPLAMAIVAARAAVNPHLSLKALAAQLGEARLRLDLLAGDDPASDIRAVFSYSYRALSAPAARLFRLLGLHPGPDVGVAAAASLAGVRKPLAGRLIDELLRASLLAEHTEGRYTFHDLLRTYAMELAHAVDGEAAVSESQHRMLDYYVHSVAAADHRLPSRRERTLDLPTARPGVAAEVFSDMRAATRWLTGDLSVLLAVVPLAAAAGFHTHAGHLVWYVAPFLRRRGYWQDWMDIQRCAVESAQRLGDAATRAHAHRGLGSAYIRFARHEEADAELRQALALYQEAGDLLGMARTHHIRCAVFDRLGQPQRLMEEALNAHGLYGAVGDRTGEATSLSDLGWSYSLLGDYQKAVVTCRQALSVLQEVGVKSGESSAWDNLGYALHHLGRYQEALECHENALAIAREVGDLYDQAILLEHLGDTHSAIGNEEAARQAWRAALSMLEELGDPESERLNAKL